MQFTIDENDEVQFDDGTTETLAHIVAHFSTMATRAQGAYKIYRVTRYKEQGTMANAVPTPRTREGEAERLMTLPFYVLSS